MVSSCAVIGISCGKREVLDISFGSTTKYPKKVSEGRVLEEKSIPVSICPPHIPYVLAYVRSRDFALRGRRRAAWNITRILAKRIPRASLHSIFVFTKSNFWAVFWTDCTHALPSQRTLIPSWSKFREVSPPLRTPSFQRKASNPPQQKSILAFLISCINTPLLHHTLSYEI